MALELMLTVDVIEAIENYLDRRRPPKELRHKVDLGYKIEKQSVILFEIRPAWDNPEVIREFGFAKATYIQNKQSWKIFWMPSNLKWRAYKPEETITTIHDFLRVVEEDPHQCFWR